MKVYGETNGCMSAKTDVGLLQSRFSGKGFEPTEDLAGADVIVYNVCAFTGFALDRAVSRYMEIWIQRKPGSEIVVTGCGVAQDTKIREKMPGADHYIPLTDLPKLGEILGLDGIEKEVPKHQEGNRLNLKIENGCTSMCAFCAIPNGRGKLRSYHVDSIVEATKEFVERNSGSEINLVGEDVGAYGLDIGTNIIELLKTMEAIEGDFKVKMDVLNPWWFLRYKNLAETIAEGVESGKIIPYFGMPLQSGSNRILKLMRRHYTREDYEGILEELERKIPEIEVATDVIVGFPAETEEDFMETFEVLARHRFAYYGVWGYSEREKTEALGMTKKVAPKTIRERTETLLALIITQQMEKHGCASLEEFHRKLEESGERIPVSINDRQLFAGGDI